MSIKESFSGFYSVREYNIIYLSNKVVKISTDLFQEKQYSNIGILYRYIKNIAHKA